MAIDLDRILPLARASRYSAPKDATAILPRSYGNFTSTGGLPADHADGGFLPSVCIDRLQWIYLLNDGPVPSTPRPQIYANDTLQVDNNSVYFWEPAFDLEGIGKPISAALFNVDPGSRAISWRGHGTINQTTGQLITNPIDALADAFAQLGGWSVFDIDPTSVLQTKADMTTLGDEIHWCFYKEESYRAWLQEILRHYHTDCWTQESGALRIMLDRSVTTLPVPILATVYADTDLIQPMKPDDYVFDVENLMNTVRISRRLKWSTGTYTDIPTVANQASTTVYGARYRSFELPACYTDAEGLRWFHGMMMRYALKPATITFTVRGLSLLPALPGTFLGFVWTDQGWTTPRLVKVLEQSIDPMRQQIRFTCFDCQRPVTDQVSLPPTLIVETRRRIAETGLDVDLSPPGPAFGLTYTGSYRQIVLRWTAPSDLDYDYTEVWAADNVNNRALAVCVRRTKGAPGQHHEESFAVADGSVYFVWLMTVDDSENGKNGGSGPTGGNWYPNSVSGGPGGFNAFPSDGGGVRAAPALVDTPGIQLAAVTDVYPTAFSSPGTHINEQILAATQGGITLTSGTFILKASVRLNVPPLHTAILLIKRGGIAGAEVGHNYFVNATNVAVTVWVDCWGGDTLPVYGAIYVVTVQVLNQAPNQVAYTVHEAGLNLWHPKR